MKKSTLLVGMLALGTVAFGQSQRMVLAEEFTQASCPPCAAQNPAYNALLNVNTTKVVSIKYQTSWPGYDPMNLQNPSDVATRVTYYNVSGVPDSPMDGTEQSGSAYLGAPANYTQTKINTEYAVPAPFTINVSHTFSSDYDSIFITCVITASQNFTTTGALKAHVAMVEKTVSFPSAPGTNGETTFYNVMRKMYPSAAGTTLGATWTSGQTQTITFAAPIPSYIYSKAQIGVVAFIQSDVDKQVQQAAFSQPQALPSDIGTTNLAGVPLYQCATSFTPSVTIKNFGTTSLTSCTINYKTDAGTVMTQPWTGSLATGASQVVALPMQTATAGGHTFTSYTSAPNGGLDDDAANNQTVRNFAIVGTAAAAPLIEGYTATTFPPAGWFIDNPDGAATWARKTGAGGFGTSTACAKLDFYNSPDGAEDDFYAKNVDLTGMTTANLKFDVAYAQYDASVADELDVMVSTDCGATWNTVYSKAGAALVTNGGTIVTAAYTPTATQWRTETVGLNSFTGNASVMIKFVGMSAYGNNVYIDNINIANAAATGIVENNAVNNISVYPNPMTNNATVDFNMVESNKVTVTLVNELGQVVINEDLGTMTAGEQKYALNAESLSNGLYFLNIKVGTSTITKKVSISK
ncbi:MAG: hypothetical protein JWP12_3122 [Bacteroidetes bacterium]|nr:hypothetical protein [Bacteroidota bacterium]